MTGEEQVDGVDAVSGRSERVRVGVVVPTIGRPSLSRLLESLAASAGPLPESVVLVDDRHHQTGSLVPSVPERLADRVRVISGAAAGPAAARNAGWRTTAADWVAFLDDDVEVGSDWLDQLHADLRRVDGDPGVGGVQGRLHVPLPAHRRATDWERNVAGLEHAIWATADLAYRRDVLARVGGFDERFPRAYREDADLGLRVTESGWRITVGTRTVLHPVRPADRWVSLRLQAGNADDALLRLLHGRRWRARTQAGPGRRGRHGLATAAMAAAVLAAMAGRWRLALAAGLGWMGQATSFAWARIRPGPRTREEVATMLVTSAAIPPLATWHWLRGLARGRRLPRSADADPNSRQTPR